MALFFGLDEFFCETSERISTSKAAEDRFRWSFDTEVVNMLVLVREGRDKRSER